MLLAWVFLYLSRAYYILYNANFMVNPLMNNIRITFAYTFYIHDFDYISLLSFCKFDGFFISLYCKHVPRGLRK
jgi:hypothetical protein